jgi:hypothetical protein
MIFITVINDLNPKIFDIIIDEFICNNSMLEDKSKPIKIEINFMYILEDKAEEAYPKFEHRLINFQDPLLTKAEIAGHLYLHYMYNDIDDDYIEYVIVTVSF